MRQRVKKRAGISYNHTMFKLRIRKKTERLFFYRNKREAFFCKFFKVTYEEGKESEWCDEEDREDAKSRRDAVDPRTRLRVPEIS